MWVLMELVETPRPGVLGRTRAAVDAFALQITTVFLTSFHTLEAMCGVPGFSRCYSLTGIDVHGHKPLHAALKAAACNACSLKGGFTERNQAAIKDLSHAGASQHLSH